MYTYSFFIFCSFSLFFNSTLSLSLCLSFSPLSLYLLLFLSLSLSLFSHSPSSSPSPHHCYLSPKGTTVWYNNPPPGRLLPNNTAISVHTDVSEVRCYTGDTSTNNDATLILKPVGSSQPLTFTNREAGYLRKNGQTSITSVANGVYTCQYTNSSGGVSYTSFAVFPRTREPSSGSSNTSKWQHMHYTCIGTCHAHATVCIMYHLLHCLYFITCTCTCTCKCCYIHLQYDSHNNVSLMSL